MHCSSAQFPREVQDGFLSEPECEILKQQVAGRLEPAKVVQKADNQYDEQVSVRNNRQIWLNYTQERDDPDVFHLLKRMHRASRIPDDDAEALQIGHYGVGEKYETHQDSDPRNDVARPATLIVYLNDVEDGGETLFPLGNRHDCTMQWRAAADGSSVFGASACCDRSDLLRVSPKKGRAVLFFNHDAAGRKDRMAQHAACPVKQGEKWIAQRWFRYEPYQRLVHPLDLRFDGLPLAPNQFTSARGDIRTLSQKKPNIYVIEEFLSSEECDLLAHLGRSRPGLAEESLTRHL
ncbi:P4H7, partial [Symbiodinium microadriaticum]